MDTFLAIVVAFFFGLPVVFVLAAIVAGPPKLKFMRVGENAALAELPVYKTKGAAGMDVYSAWAFALQPGETRVISTGLAVEVPEGYELQIRPRSSLALKGITVMNTPGTVDSDYRGEIGVILTNHGREEFCAASGDRIAQFVLAKYERLEPAWADQLSSTTRGAGGFGSTGK